MREKKKFLFFFEQIVFLSPRERESENRLDMDKKNHLKFHGDTESRLFVCGAAASWAHSIMVHDIFIAAKLMRKRD
jgi:hypothetical protein